MYYTESEIYQIGRVRHRWAATYTSSNSFHKNYEQTKGETIMHNHEKLTKREKAIIGAAVVTTCIAGYFGYKYFSGNKLKKQLIGDYKYLEDSVDTLMAAMEETGRI